MAGKNVDEILIGTGTLYYDELDGAEAVFPADPTTSPAAGWLEFGYTDDGVSVDVDRTYEDVMVAELFDPVAVLKTQQSFSVVAAFAQASLENLLVAFGGSIAADTPTGFDTWTAPTTTADTKYELLFRTAAPTISSVAKVRDWQFPRAVPTGAVSMAHKKAPAKTLIAVEFRVLVPSAGSIVTVIDEQ
jgi:hypothetical protein